MITIFIPTPLRKFTDEKSSIQLTAENVAEAINMLVSSHPALTPYIYDEADLIRKHVRIYLGEDDIREKEGFQTRLQDGDELSIIPAIAGGSHL